MKIPKQINWYKRPKPHDYPAAQSFLSLLYADPRALQLLKELKRAPVVQFKAKDIFCASGLPLLGISNSHVAKDRKKIKKGISLSPVLLVREAFISKGVIADCYHRLCAVYSFDKDAIIPCKIV